MSLRSQFKDTLGRLPYAAELFWLLRNRQKTPLTRFSLQILKENLPQMVAQAAPHAATAEPAGKLFLFASLHFWINHTALTGMVLHGLGYDVTLGYLPYSDFSKPVSKFDLRSNDLYARHVLELASPALKSLSLLEMQPAASLPAELLAAITQISTFDTRYILQREEVTGQEPIFRFRHERNLQAARRAYAYFLAERPDGVIVPNGMIQEFGAVYETARFLGIPVVTYEFGEQDQRVWLGRDRWVIHHIIDPLWESRQERILDAGQRAWLENFLAGRQTAFTGAQFAHLWQKADRSGGASIRQALGLDERPVVLLPTNVLGDSATLGLNVFSASMTDWLEHVLPVLAARPEVQVVIRIHPGETLTVGPSVTEIIQRLLPDLPAHIHLIGPREKVNTYDLMEITDLALVYTTTAGLEIALRGIPVLVSGRAHYRKKGFTLEADSWEEYFASLEAALKSPARLSAAQLERAWNYAYCFFKEYPQPFPWHVEKVRLALQKRPVAYVLSPEGRAQYECTFRQLAGADPSSPDQPGCAGIL